MEPGSKGPARPRGAKGPGVLLVALILILGCSLPLAILWPMQSSAQIASHVLLDRAVAGVTGTLFEGKPTRVYGGKWLFKNDVQKPYRRPHSSHGLWSAKWAVVTTINSPTAQIMDTVNLKDWAVVIVGDKGGRPFNITAPNAVYLDTATQQDWGGAFPTLLQLLPWRHFGRKNLGYLYAIAHGAHQIWDFDDDNGLIMGLDPKPAASGVFSVQVGSNCTVFNPYPLMGAPATVEALGPAAWPRGLPLDMLKVNCPYKLKQGQLDNVTVIQSLAQHEPDVDGIFRLTRTVPFYFDASSTSTLVIPKGVMVPYNAQATLVMQPAFWSLILPITVHGRVSDILRSYIAQRLLWDAGQQVAFAPPMVVQIRSPHNYLADMQAEQDLYFKVPELVRFLHHWQGTSSTIAGRFEELVVSLYERQYFGAKDVQLVQQWLLALAAVGYQLPELESSSNNHLVTYDHLEDGKVIIGQTNPSQQPASIPSLDFSEGTCCVGAYVKSHMPLDAVCRFRKSRYGLVHRPEERPTHFGISCLSLAIDFSPQTPEFGVLVNVFDAGDKLRIVLTQLIKLTTRPWELVVAFDGCSKQDTSYASATGVLDRLKSWRQCRYSAQDVDVARVWQTKLNWTGSQGDIGNECWLQPSSLVGVRFITTNGTGLYATAANNLKMLSSRASKYFILIDDDQLMTTPAWNEKLAYPLEKWPEVFSASARCAHGFPNISTVYGTKCQDTSKPQPQHKAGRCVFYEGDSGNRGPLILRVNYTQQLGYMDELHHAGIITKHDDHDLNYRAYHQRAWVSGHIPIDYTEERARMGPTSDQTGRLRSEYQEWFFSRRGQSSVADNRWTEASNTHSQQRVISDPSWHPLCGNVTT